MFINNLIAGYGDMTLAGSGVATKITMITGMLCIEVGQGVQPLLGYSLTLNCLQSSIRMVP